MLALNAEDRGVAIRSIAEDICLRAWSMRHWERRQALRQAQANITRSSSLWEERMRRQQAELRDARTARARLVAADSDAAYSARAVRQIDQMDEAAYRHIRLSGGVAGLESPAP